MEPQIDSFEPAAQADIQDTPIDNPVAIVEQAETPQVDHAFYVDPTFWVLISFLIFVALAWRPLGKFLANALDSRSRKIEEELAQAVSLREEAQSLLAEYQRKQRENLEEAKRIVEQTKRDASAMSKLAEAELRETLEKRKLLAMEKIAQAEKHAIQMVQKNVVEMALKASHEIMLEAANDSDSIDKALNDINLKLK